MEAKIKVHTHTNLMLQNPNLKLQKNRLPKKLRSKTFLGQTPGTYIIIYDITESYNFVVMLNLCKINIAKLLAPHITFAKVNKKNLQFTTTSTELFNDSTPLLATQVYKPALVTWILVTSKFCDVDSTVFLCIH